jgi:hypothetical protein
MLTIIEGAGLLAALLCVVGIGAIFAYECGRTE